MLGVTDYLQLAQECAQLADRMKGDEKRRLLTVADAWLRLADTAAIEASKLDGEVAPLVPVKRPA
jgi:hypothetical protein